MLKADTRSISVGTAGVSALSSVGQPQFAMSNRRISSADAEVFGQSYAWKNKQAHGVFGGHTAVHNPKICVPAVGRPSHRLVQTFERGFARSAMVAMPCFHSTMEEGRRGALEQLQKVLPIAAVSDVSHCDSIGNVAPD